MNTVIEHILERRGKKVTVNDGRKIGLVLFGGFMAGVRGGGALIALEEMGLAHSFDKIFTYSSGFPNACYLLAEKTKLGTSIYYDDLTGRRFLNFFRFWKAADIDFLITVFQNKKVLPLNTIFQSKTEIHNRFVNFTKKEIEYLEVHCAGEENFWKFMKAATSASFVSPGKVEIAGSKYKDLGVFGNHWEEHIKFALSHNLTDILVIYCYNGQSKKARAQSPILHQIIPPEDWGMRRFETRAEELKKMCQDMGRLVKSHFGLNEGIVL